MGDVVAAVGRPIGDRVGEQVDARVEQGAAVGQALGRHPVEEVLEEAGVDAVHLVMQLDRVGMALPLPPSLMTRWEMKWKGGACTPLMMYLVWSLQPPTCSVAVRARSEAKAKAMRSSCMRTTFSMLASVVWVPLTAIMAGGVQAPPGIGPRVPPMFTSMSRTLVRCRSSRSRSTLLRSVRPSRSCRSFRTRSLTDIRRATTFWNRPGSVCMAPARPDEPLVDVPGIVVADAQGAPGGERQRVVPVGPFAPGVQGERLLAGRHLAGDEEVVRLGGDGSCLVSLPVTRAPVPAAMGPPLWLRECLKLRPRTKIELAGVASQLARGAVLVDAHHAGVAERPHGARPVAVGVTAVALDGSVLLQHQRRVDLAPGGESARAKRGCKMSSAGSPRTTPPVPRRKRRRPKFFFDMFMSPQGIRLTKASVATRFKMSSLTGRLARERCPAWLTRLRSASLAMSVSRP